MSGMVPNRTPAPLSTSRGGPLVLAHGLVQEDERLQDGRLTGGVEPREQRQRRKRQPQ